MDNSAIVQMDLLAINDDDDDGEKVSDDNNKLHSSEVDNKQFDSEQKSAMKKKKTNTKQAKKERKLVQVFVQKFLVPKLASEAPELVAELTKPVPFNSEVEHRNLLVDNRDYQVRLSTENLLALLKDNLQIVIEDLFVMPHKTWFLLRFCSAQGAVAFKNYLSVDKTTITGINQCSSIPDRVYDLIVEQYLPEVKQVISSFGDIKSDDGRVDTVEGLKLIPNFISIQEEDLLFRFAEGCFEAPEDSTQVSRLKNRSSVHFGHVFDYIRNTISSVSEISVLDSKLPEEVRFLLNRFVQEKIIPELPDQLTINRYRGDNHIPAHVDTHSMCTEWIVSVSVHSDVVMLLTNPRDSHQKSPTTMMVTLPRRSVLLMRDEVRYLWRHAIAQTAVDIRPLRRGSCSSSSAVSNITPPPPTNLPSSRLSLCPRDLRYSFTFRKVRPPGYRCQCPYAESCDTQSPKSQAQPLKVCDDADDDGSITETRAIKLEREYVHRTYDQIASHFSATRYGQWPAVVSFLSDLPRGSLVLDVGCGNGKYLSVQRDRLFSIGSDRSKNLLDICAGERGFEVFQDDCLTIGHTVREGLFDAVICIAVIHHLATEERRLEALRSIVRLLDSGGRALVYVWAFEQKKDGYASKYLKKASPDASEAASNAAKPAEISIHTNRTEFKQQDLFVPWKKANNNGGKKVEVAEVQQQEQDSTKLRFYHVFREGELEALIGKLQGEVQLEQIFYDQGNWCAIFHKC